MIDLIKRARFRIALTYKLYRLQTLIKNRDFEPECSILIFSDPRGGSTWLAELINCIPKSFIYWEPLSISHIPDIQNLNFGWRQHIPSSVKWEEARNVFNKILSIQYINEWTTKRMDIKSLQFGKYPIIKFCRGNHLVKWLVKQYSFKYIPVVLLRHPLAVVASQLNQGGWAGEFSSFEIPDVPYNGIYEEHKAFLNTIVSKEESLLTTWCITNKDLLGRYDEAWHLIYYEDLVLEPLKILNQLFSLWNIPVPPSIAKKVTDWSSTSIETSKELDKMNQIKKWTSVFNDAQLVRFQAILDYFEVTVYSTKSILPQRGLQIRTL